jgi:hypothetical protein
MFPKKRVIEDAGHFSSKWAPVVLRFFQLFIGDQPAAEALTIDTLAEYIRAPGADDNASVRLLRQAFMKAVAAKTVPSQLADPVVRAVTQLEPNKRAVIVLLRGLSMDLVTVGQITGLDQVRVRRLFVDALEELRWLLGSSKKTGPVLQTFRESQ